jgi:hypothetical protein
MPDYSGYAQRQQQDPNLAAWSNISGNLANIFGLDPAKAAEARRGIQQEDYNEMRNKTYLRQQAANKELGDLISRGMDPATGEFRNPEDYSTYARLAAELGSTPNVHYGTGFHARQLAEQESAANRVAEKKKERDEAERAAREAEAEGKAAERYRAGIKKEADAILAYGVKGRTYNLPAAINKFAFRLSGGAGTPGFTGGWFEESSKTKGNKDIPDKDREFVMTKAFSDWLKDNGYFAMSMDPAKFKGIGESSGPLLDTAGQLSGILGGISRDNPHVISLAKQLMINQYGDINDTKSSTLVADSADSLKATVDEIINQIQTDPRKDPGVRHVIVRKTYRDPKTGRLVEGHEKYNLDELIGKDPSGKLIYSPSESLGQNHPNIFFKGGR